MFSFSMHLLIDGGNDHCGTGSLEAFGHNYDQNGNYQGMRFFIGHITSVEKIAAVANFRFQDIVEIHDLTSINYKSIFSRKFHISA